MHSSTSSSERGSRRAFLWLVAALCTFMVMLEIGSRLVVPRVSHQVGRFQSDRANAIGMSREKARPLESMLLVGNSLLLEGIDRRQLQSKLAGSFSVSLFPLENTTYLDWYFGLRRLFREGARPDVVVLCMNARQILSDATSGEFFAHFHMDLWDLGAVAALGGLDNMTASSYLLANQSYWLATKSNIRNGVLERALPGASMLAGRLAAAPRGSGEPLLVPVEEVVSRLLELRMLADAFGTRFIWLVPPTLDAGDPSVDIMSEAARAGVDVVIPLAPGSLPESAFSDGFHLNRLGAHLFTDASAERLLDFAAAAAVTADQ